MSKENIPPLLQQYRENMLDASNNVSIRHNYKTTLENIRDYCDRALSDFERQTNRKRK
jgi:hypothetical protein